jgi:excinuclease UvrABC nuclease subunit
MLEAARQLAFEKAALLRDQIECLQGGQLDPATGAAKMKRARKKSKGVYNAAGLPRKRKR